jgi:hypothetical protein
MNPLLGNVHRYPKPPLLVQLVKERAAKGGVLKIRDKPTQKEQ